MYRLWLACFAPALACATPVINVSLDDPPRARWRHAARHFKAWFHEHYQFLVDAAAELETDWSWEQLEELRHSANFSHEIKEEVRGYAKALGHPEATVKLLMDLIMIYDMGVSGALGCTGLVVPRADGTTIYGRNLDMRTSDLFMQDIVFTAVFIKNGKEIAQAVTFLGWVGIHTGLRLDGSFSIGLNTRYEPKKGKLTFLPVDALKPLRVGQSWVESTLAASRAGGKAVTLMLRKALLSESTFAGAVSSIAMTPFLSPLYVILAGGSGSQGAVITVGRAEERGVPGFLDVALMSAVSGKWFITQTNDDYWEVPLDPRRRAAEEMVKRIAKKRDPSEDDVMGILRTPPVCFYGTALSYVCTPANGTDLLWVDHC